MDMAVATEVDRRAWAVEQAVQTAGALPQAWVSEARDDRPVFHVADPEKFVLGLADSFLAYVSQPVVAASSKLIDAARAYDGTQNAAALIGALADALESREVR